MKIVNVAYWCLSKAFFFLEEIAHAVYSIKLPINVICLELFLLLYKALAIKGEW